MTIQRYKGISISKALKLIDSCYRYSSFNCSSRITRNFHSSPISLQTVDKTLLSKIRKKTGFSISHCKKALLLHECDLEKAEEWLKKEAQAHGWDKATKLSSRPTAQGLIGLHIDGNIGGMVEVNCETDFVAKNEDFKALVQNICKNFTLSASSIETSNQTQPVKEWFDKERLVEMKAEDGKSISDHVAMAIGKIGENIQLARGVKFRAPQGLNLFGYVHPSSAEKNSHVGKCGAIVAFNNITNHELVRQLSAHIVGMNPTKIGSLNDVRKKVEVECEEQATEVKEENINATEVKEENINATEVKEENINEEDDEITPTVRVKSQETLVFQDFLSDQEMTVGETLIENDIEIIDFVRLECGEDNSEES